MQFQNIRKERLASGELSKILNYPLDTKYKEVPFNLEKFMKDRVSFAKSLKKDIDKTTLGEKESQYLEENLKIDDIRYEAGLISTFDYLNSVNSYRSSQAEYYKMIKNLVVATIELENIYK